VGLIDEAACLGGYLSTMLSFRLFGIPVGVHATFLLIVLFGRPRTVLDGVLWFAAAFVAILMHELGHALVARALGGEGISITLFGFGGLTSFSHGPAVTHGRSFLISAAGSAVGIVAGLAVVASGRAGLLDTFPDNAITFLEFFVFAALVWGVLNWIPIVPLDGGHMVQHLAAVFNEDRAPLIGQIITWISVAVVVPLAMANGFQFGAVIIVLFAAMGFRNYRAQEAAKKSVDRPEVIAPAPPADPTPPVPPPEFPI
jgi:Zn-dependent protease